MLITNYEHFHNTTNAYIWMIKHIIPNDINGNQSNLKLDI